MGRSHGGCHGSATPPAATARAVIVARNLLVPEGAGDGFGMPAWGHFASPFTLSSPVSQVADFGIVIRSCEPTEPTSGQFRYLPHGFRSDAESRHPHG